jgi:hypothetical protein
MDPSARSADIEIWHLSRARPEPTPGPEPGPEPEPKPARSYSAEEVEVLDAVCEAEMAAIMEELDKEPDNLGLLQQLQAIHVKRAQLHI